MRLYPFCHGCDNFGCTIKPSNLNEVQGETENPTYNDLHATLASQILIMQFLGFIFRLFRSGV
jgi:hypothetical protein